VGVLASPAASQRLTAMTGLFASVFSANVYLDHVNQGYFDVSTTLDPFLHTWTLGVEEQFYLLFPALLGISWWIARRRTPGTRVLVAATVVLLVSVASIALAFRLSAGPIGGGVTAQQRLAFYGSPTRAWEFGAGALLALLISIVRLPPRPVPRLLAELLGLAGVVAIGVGAFATKNTSHLPGKATLLTVFGACALIAAGSVDSVPTRLLGVRPLTWIGDLSYSWYLWHWPLIVFAVALFPSTPGAAKVAAAISLLPAWVSFRYVENPIRHDRRWLSPRRGLALAAGSIAVSAAFCAGLLGATKALGAASTIGAWQRAVVPHANQTHGCDSADPIWHWPPTSHCIWRVPQARGSVVLVGDSNAGHFTEPVVRAANRAGFDATVATLHSCPFANVELLGGDVTLHDCRRFVQGSVAELIRRRPSLVIIAQRTDSYLDSTNIGLARLDGAGASYEPGAKARLLERGLSRTIEVLKRAGIPVLLVQTIPKVPAPSIGCAVLRILTRSCIGSVSRSVADRQLRPAVGLERAAAAAAGRTPTINFENEFCSSTRCRSVRSNILLYGDKTHLTVGGSLTLTKAFMGAIRAHARPAKTELGVHAARAQDEHASPPLVVRADKSVAGIRALSKLARATSVLGPPDSRRRVGASECRAVWRSLGLTLGYLDLSSSDPCRLGVMVTAAATSTAWRTDRGLRVGDHTARIRRLYPRARRVALAPYGGWWLITRHTCPTTGAQAYPGLRAKTSTGEVLALIVTVAACE